MIRRPILPFPPNWQKARHVALTCTLGFRCKEGVVLAADSQITVGDFSKFPESKLRMRVLQTEHPYFLAYAGDSVLSKEVMDRLAKAIGEAERGQKDVVAAVRKECTKFGKTIQLLWARRSTASNGEQKYRLWQIFGRNVAPADAEPVCIGIGQHFVGKLLSDFHHSALPIKEGALLAILALRLAETAAIGVERPFQVFLLKDKGGYLEMPQNEIVETCAAYDDLRKALRPLILNYTDWNIKDARFESELKEFCKQIRSYRARMERTYAERLEREIASSEKDDATDAE